MPCSEIIADFSQIHTNTLCGQNVGLLKPKLAVHILIIGGSNLVYKNQSVNAV